MIKRIVHISDYHARTVSRQEEYLQFNENLEKELKRVDPDVIVFTGDLVHTKTNLSPELLRTANDFISRLSNIAPLHIIVGNHDMNVSNLNRMDSVSPIVEGVKGKANHVIFYYKKSGFYEIGDDIVFGAFSLLDKDNWPILDRGEKKKTRTYIALFHGLLNFSEAETGFKLTGSEHNVGMFAEYDFAFLGDVHKCQFLNDDKTVAYSGSCLQQGYGESSHKGFLLWDIKDRTCEFVPVKNDWCYKTINISSDDPAQDLKLDRIAKHLYLRLVFEKPYTAVQISDVCNVVKRQFKPEKLNTFFLPETGLSSVDDDVQILHAEDYSDILVQRKLLTDYFEGDQTVDVGNVSKVHEEIVSLLPEQEDKMFSAKWEPIVMKWGNTFSFGNDNAFYFKNLRGITGIFGKNFSGKSSVLDTLLYILYNSTLRTSRGVDIINVNGDGCWGEFQFAIDDKDYRICRTTKRKKNGIKGTVTFEVMDQNKWSSLAGETGPETDKIIRRYLGNINDFTTTTFSPQGYITKFIDDEHRNRKDLLAKFLGLDVFDELQEIAKQKTQEIESQIRVFEKSDDIEKLTNLQQSEKAAREVYTELQGKEIVITKSIEDALIDINGLSNSLADVDDSIASLSEQSILRDIDEADGELLGVNTKIEKAGETIQIRKDELLKIDVDIIDVDLAEIATLETDVDSLREKLGQTQSQIGSLGTSLKGDERKVEVLGLHDWFETTEECHKCHFLKDAFVAKENLPKTELRIDGLQVEIDSCVEEGKKKKTLLDGLKEAAQKLDKRNECKLTLERDEATLAYLKSNLTAVAAKKQEFVYLLERYRDSKEKIEENRVIDGKIVLAEGLRVEKQSMLDKLKVQIDESNRLLVRTETLQEELVKRIGDHRERQVEVEAYRRFIEAVHRDGIPAQVISRHLVLINRELNSILENSVDFSVVLEMSPKRELLMYISRTDEDKRYLEGASGMEKTVASIALRAALSNVIILPKCDMLVIDEGFGTLDPENLSNMAHLFSFLRTLFSSIVVISHIDNIQDICDNIVMVEKNSEDISTIVGV